MTEPYLYCCKGIVGVKADGAEKLTLELQITLKAWRCLTPRGAERKNEAKSEKGRTFREEVSLFCF